MSSVADFPVADVRWLAIADSGGASVRGVGRRKNEDCFVVDPDGRFFVVADGIGGAVAGEIASRTACDTLRDELSRVSQRNNNTLKPDFEDLCDREKHICAEVLSAMKLANDRVVAAGQQSWLHRDMGTTAIAAVVIGDRLYLSSIGDSRAYLIREGSALRLTRDHTMTAGLVEAGLLTDDEAATHQYRNVLYKYLGAWTDDAPADVQSLRLQQGDALVLATDGVSKWVPEMDIAEFVTENVDPQQAAESLIERAVACGSSDDATCVVAFLTHEFDVCR